MALVLTIDDLGNGSGVSATIAGSAPGSTNTFFYQLVQNPFAPLSWTNAGSLVGDGSTTIALNPCYAFYYVQNTNGSVVTVSNIVYSQCSWNTDSVLYRCLTAIQAQLQTLTLAGLTSSQIQVRYLPRALEEIDTWPLVCISPLGQESNPPYMTSIDEVDEPITVAYIAPQNANYNANLRANTKIREQINRRLRNQRLPGVPECMTVEQVPSGIMDLSAFAHLWFLGISIFRVKTRQTRGA